jgi:hypothetical protein
MPNRLSFFNRREWTGFAILAILLLVVLPLSLDVFRLNLVGKYLTYAFVALGLVLCWGSAGILSLGQVECNGGNPGQVQSRVTAYQQFVQILGTTAGANLYC